MKNQPDTRQLDLIDYLRTMDEPKYSAVGLARKYGLSRGQAQALIELHGPTRRILDAVIASMSYN